MEEPGTERSWYKKKRYILPVTALAAISGAGMMGDTPPEPVVPIVPTELAPIETEVAESEPKALKVESPSVPAASSGNCHPSYSGCLDASASDYDCAGGPGNGPHYTGPVRVTGYDEFGLDKDGNGYGCE